MLSETVVEVFKLSCFLFSLYIIPYVYLHHYSFRFRSWSWWNHLRKCTSYAQTLCRGWKRKFHRSRNQHYFFFLVCGIFRENALEMHEHRANIKQVA